MDCKSYFFLLCYRRTLYTPPWETSPIIKKKRPPTSSSSLKNCLGWSGDRTCEKNRLCERRPKNEKKNERNVVPEKSRKKREKRNWFTSRGLKRQKSWWWPLGHWCLVLFHDRFYFLHLVRNLVGVFDHFFENNVLMTRDQDSRELQFDLGKILWCLLTVTVFCSCLGSVLM